MHVVTSALVGEEVSGFLLPLLTEVVYILGSTCAWGTTAASAYKGAWREQPGNVSPLELPREGGLVFHCRNRQLNLIPSQSLPFELPIPSVI